MRKRRTPKPAVEDLAVRVRAAGARATPARVEVLRILLGAEHALTHQEVEARLGGRADRVTVYRVLDWLVQAGLAHRVTDDERVFRFSAAGDRADHAEHGHFRCEQCTRVFCLDAPPVARPRVPAGFRVSHVDFNLRGQCAHCARGRA